MSESQSLSPNEVMSSAAWVQKGSGRVAEGEERKGSLASSKRQSVEGGSRPEGMAGSCDVAAGPRGPTSYYSSCGWDQPGSWALAENTGSWLTPAFSTSGNRRQFSQALDSRTHHSKFILVA